MKCPFQLFLLFNSAKKKNRVQTDNVHGQGGTAASQRFTGLFKQWRLNRK